MKWLKKVLLNLLLILKIWYYNLRKPQIKSIIRKKKQIRIVFFVLYDNMWKSDGLFRLLLASDRFVPYIISSPYPHHPRDFSQNNQKRLESFFKEKGFPYFNGYNFEKDELFDIHSFSPDIVFYQQPYNTGYKQFKIESLWANCLFGYIPYTYELEDSPKMVNGLLMNIAWKVFLPSNYEVKRQRKILINKGQNLVETGSLLADRFLAPVGLSIKNPWKIKDDSIKKVIWAPHHSILQTDTLHYSNFLDVADDMLQLALSFKDMIQFVFKPHPVLKRKLYTIDGWGREKTDKYYERWANLSNATIVEGEYVDLFRTSDAMIHDCSTFTAEYLFTKKPVMFLVRNQCSPDFNDFGKMCYNLHYIGNSIIDIQSFLNDVVLGGHDSKQSQREAFFERYLLPKDKEDTAHRMFNQFDADFNN